MKDVAASEEPSAIETPNLPAGWTMATVGDVGIVELGRQRSPENHSGPCMRPYLRAANVTWAGIDLSDVMEMNFDEADFARFSLAPGDVLLNEGSGSASEVGKPAIWRGEIVGCCFQNTLLRVRPEACTSEFLERFFYFCAKTRRFVPSTQGVNIFHIGKAGLSRFRMPLPPLPEQPRILAKLDRVSARSRAARDHLARTTKLAARAKQAILAAAFRGELTADWRARIGHSDEWATQEIRRVASVVTGSTPPTKGADRFFGGAMPFFKPTDLDAGYDVREARQWLTAEGIRVARAISAGSTLVTCIGATIGKTGFARVDCCTNQQINALVPDRAKVTPEYLFWMVMSPDFQSEIMANASATTLPIINKGRFEKLPLPIPLLAEQEEIVRRIEAAFARIDRLTAEAARAAHLLDRLDERLLAKAFRGELVPQDPADEPAEALLARIRAARADAPRPRRGRRAAAAT